MPVPVPEPIQRAAEGRSIVEAPPPQPVSAAPAAGEKPDAPLYERLSAAMRRRGLRKRDLAEIFSTTAPTITYWLRGAEVGPDGKILGRPIPPEAAPLVARWIETGEPPTKEELHKIPKRKSPRPVKSKRAARHRR